MEKNNVLQFPNIKEQREKEALYENIKDRLAFAVTPEYYITVVDKTLQMRDQQNKVVTEFPTGPYDVLLLLQVTHAMVSGQIMADKLQELGVDLEELLDDDLITKKLMENYVRPE